MNDVLFSSKVDTWCTPENLLEVVRKFAPIGLDPCSGPGSIVKAQTEFFPVLDGLKQEWSNHGLTFINPPYSQIKEWCRKANYEGLEEGTEIILLIPARTDTKYWHKYIIHSNAICFWKGRLKFLGAPTSAPFPSALVYWGENRERFMDVFSEYGWCVTTYRECDL